MRKLISEWKSGRKTWSVTLREGRRARVLVRALRKIFGSKGNDLIGKWKKLHN
jgi:hypothetical protein